MSGIDYARLRGAICIEQVLALLDFHANEAIGDEVGGPCPIHGSTSSTSRSFSANLRKHTYRCFKCGAGGNQLDLWVATSKLSIYDAARDLCVRLGIESPEISRW
jgi:DNA primase